MKNECRKQCEGCAFKPDSEANGEAVSTLKAQIAVMTPAPFYCHDTMEDWETVDSTSDRKQLLQKGMKICEGWKKAVKELNETGYYSDPVNTRFYGNTASQTLELYLKDKNPDNKKQWLEILQHGLKFLYNRVKSFGGEKIVSIKNYE